ncbi:MAG: PilW family protein, partial [Xanthomonadales bacterium]|nr:PilW family protein [Xanthomonadales bacterium]
EFMQVLYAEDRDGDKVADRWVRAQNWLNEGDVQAVKVALLLSTRQPFEPAASKLITLLDEPIATPVDGHLRRVRSMTTTIRSRLR